MSEAPPTVNVKSILKLRKKLIEDVAAPWYGTTQTGEGLYDFVRDIHHALPREVPLDAVYHTLAPTFASVEITLRNFGPVAWRIAANLDTLKEGRPATVWTTQHEDEWVPVQVMRHDPSRNKFNELQHKYSLLVLAGTPCARRIQKYWSPKFIPVAARRLGFGGFKSKYRYTNPKDIISLRFMVKLEPKYTTSDGPGFFEIACPSGMQTYNKTMILKPRLRVGMPCPKGYVHRCAQCVIGYEECPAATHLRTFVRQFCTHCGLNQIFDPEVETDRCVPCHERWLLRPRKKE